MSIYFPESDVAIEVIAESQGLPEADCGSDAVRIYVSEEQVGDPELVEALGYLIHGREKKLARERRSGISRAATRERAQGEAGKATDAGKAGAATPEQKPVTEGEGQQGRGADKEQRDRDPQELMEDLLDAQDELAEALSEVTGELLVSPGPDLDGADEDAGSDGLNDDAYDAFEELGCYEYWLQDWLDDLCSARTRSMRRPGREISIGSCKNLYLTM